jgi:HlyD family secretion protein
MGDQLTNDLNALRIDRSEPAPSSGGGLGRALGWLLVLGALGGGSAWAWPRVQGRVFKTEVRLGEVRTVSPAQSATQVSATGYVVALRVSRVQPRASGRVAQVRVHEGETVRAGQVLLVLDASESRAAIAAAQARVLAAQARAAVSRANLAEATVALERQRRLAATGAAPRATVEDLEARMGPLRALIEATQAEVRAAQAEVASLRINLGQLTLTAPFDGRVVNRPPQLGELVGLGALSGTTTANAAAAVVEIIDPTSLVVEVDVPEGRLGLVRIGGPCEVALDAFPGRRVRCAVSAIGNRVDRCEGHGARAGALHRRGRGVLPEMSARVSFLTEALSDAALTARPHTVLPAAAVTARGGQRVVFTVEDGVARQQPVRLGPQEGDGFRLEEGPPPGARVVLGPPATLNDGNPVKETTR